MTETVERINTALHKVIFEYTASINDLYSLKDIGDFFSGKADDSTEKRIVQKLYFIKNIAGHKAEISILNLHGKKLLTTDTKEDKENLLYRTD